MIIHHLLMFFQSYKPKNRIYLDYAGTCLPSKKIINFQKKLGIENEYNHFGIYEPAVKLKKILEEKRSLLASLIGANDDEIFFAPSATLANFASIKGVFSSAIKKGIVKPHIIASPVEHPSIHGLLLSMVKNQEIELDFLPLKSDGQVELKDLNNKIKENTVLVCMMAVNNETGTVFPVDTLVKKVNLFKKENFDNLIYPLIMSDICQYAVCNKINVNKLGCDILVFNAHKFGGPKGVSFLYKKRGISLEPVFFGGNQEKGFFPGTQNIKNILTAIYSFEERIKDLDNGFLDSIARSKGDLEKKLLSLSSSIKKTINIETSPHILHTTFLGLESEHLAILLSNEGIDVSTKSACKSNDPLAQSHVISALDSAGIFSEYKKTDQDKMAFIRWSLGKELKKKEIKKIINTVKKIIELYNIKV